MLNRLTKFAKSPQGKKLMTQAQQLAKDPKTREKINEARERLQHKEKAEPKPQTPGTPPAEKTPPQG